MRRRQLWPLCACSTIYVSAPTPWSTILPICLLLLNLCLHASGEQNNNLGGGGSNGSTTGFIFLEGGSGLANIKCLGTGNQLSNNILSVSSTAVSSLETTADAEPQQPHAAGRCFFNESLVKLLDSFSTQFAFNLAPQTSNASEEAIDGMAFVISQDPSYVGMYGGYLGVLDDGSQANSSSNANRTLAIEFDAFTNPEFNDPLYHHVGVDHGSMNSTITAQAGYYEAVPCSNNVTFIETNLTGDGRIQAWIDYNGSSQQLSVTMTPLVGIRPLKPLLTTRLNLSAIFQRTTGVYVGFSSSSGRNDPGWAYVLDWSFNVSGPAAPLYPKRVLVITCPTSRRVNWGLVLGVSLPTTFAIVGVGVLLGGWYPRKVRHSLRRQFQFLELENLDSRPKEYSYKELSKATENFSPELELGRGGFGVVYKGTLSASAGSNVIAVKKIIPRSNSAQGQQEYVSEMKVIGRLRHRNLVQLLGYCQDRKGEVMQVYEYMPNGSLDHLLFSRTTPADSLTALSWDRRFHIITGVAAALVYLHEEWKQLIVHRDVKVSNVMLDSAFNARLGDFGLARLYEHSQPPNFTKMAGTFGYMAPEIHNGEFTEKSDVFSFGIVVLEIVTGRRSIDFKRPPGEEQLAAWVATLNENARISNAADAELEGNFRQDELLKALHVGLLCSHPDPVERPTMRQALRMLAGQSPLTPFRPVQSEPNARFRINFGQDSTMSYSRGKTDSIFNNSRNVEIEVDTGEAPLLAMDNDSGRRFHNSTTYSDVANTSLIR